MEIMELWICYPQRFHKYYGNYGIMDLSLPEKSIKIMELWNYGFVSPGEIHKNYGIMEL